MTAWSLLGPIAGGNAGDQDHQAALGITAYLAGPSIGHFYAGAGGVSHHRGGLELYSACAWSGA